MKSNVKKKTKKNFKNFLTKNKWDDRIEKVFRKEDKTTFLKNRMLKKFLKKLLKSSWHRIIKMLNYKSC